MNKKKSNRNLSLTQFAVSTIVQANPAVTHVPVMTKETLYKEIGTQNIHIKVYAPRGKINSKNWPRMMIAAKEAQHKTTTITIAKMTKSFQRIETRISNFMSNQLGL